MIIHIYAKVSKKIQNNLVERNPKQCFMLFQFVSTPIVFNYKSKRYSFKLFHMVSLYCNQGGIRMVYTLSDKLGKHYGNKYRNKER